MSVSRARRRTRWIALALVGAILIGCTQGSTSIPTSPPTTASTPRATAAASTTATPATSPTAGPTSTPGAAVPAPAAVTLTGRLPDTSATVPPGEGESGRVTVHWEGVPGATAYRIYERSCDGTVRSALDLGRDERQYGPLQPCRPGGDLGVSAVLPAGESAITWARGAR